MKPRSVASSQTGRRGHDVRPHAWSPVGDSILIAAFAVEPAIAGPNLALLDDGAAHPGRQLVSLWRVEADGTNVELLADGLNYFGVTQ
jgi:hypothetical protein